MARRQQAWAEQLSKLALLPNAEASDTTGVATSERTDPFVRWSFSADAGAKGPGEPKDSRTSVAPSRWRLGADRVALADGAAALALRSKQGGLSTGFREQRGRHRRALCVEGAGHKSRHAGAHRFQRI
uniref:Uncharacterized protein n=1 Tax=Parastrongyloides trichosuri TaxID=131310 RepID=A0A0N4Z1I5_PARTI